MGSSSSVHASPSTFLTACDFENGYGWEMPEESSSDESSVDDEDVNDKNERDDAFMSVATEDYNPPPNKFFTVTDFDSVKKKHFEIKDKYVKFLGAFMKEEIPQSIEHAKVMSSKELKDNGSHDKNHKYVIDPYVLAEMVCLVAKILF